jgi:glycosyltransferase involved in cell wall biosynthesis
MHLTVAVPTCNRADRLRQTLTHVSRLRVPAGCLWELVIVDNGSTDATPDVLDTFRAQLPLRVVREAQSGVAHARNAAVRAASGDYMLWIDDDVSVDPGWLAGYVAAFRAYPDAALFGGPIAAEFEATPPAWLVEILPQVAAAYGLRDLGMSPVALSPGILPFGSNYAVRTAIHRDYRYDPRLGHHGDRMMIGEETSVFRAILEAGHTGWWVPAARVTHFIPRQRQTWTHLAERWYLAGVSWALQSTPDASSRFLERPLWLWTLALRRQALYSLRRIRYSKTRLVRELRDARSAWGALEGYRRLASAARDVSSETHHAPSA